MLNSFAMIFGKCVWLPPSAKAAFLALAYFYGLDPRTLPSEYEAGIVQQLVADGRTAEQAAAEMKWLDGCFASYVVPDDKRSPGSHQ